ncbi:hypothetical protein FQA39_LY14816 [Lamprigera yunnana]|nr:hypothetical protein FQA39_LY14816 [Lamprigera yunnana]
MSDSEEFSDYCSSGSEYTPENDPALNKVKKSHISIQTLSPLPTPKSKTKNKRKSRSKASSKILTLSPNKDLLVEAEIKRQKRKETLERKQKCKLEKGQIQKKKQLKRKIVETDEESEDELKEDYLCDDDELDDTSDYDVL